MPLPNKNKIIIAAAGARKTTYLVEKALAEKDGTSLITTFTNENLEQIRNAIIAINGCVPEHISVMTLFSFFLQHCARPYQNSIASKPIRSINFISEPLRFIRRANVDKYYFDSGNNLYEKYVSDFAMACNDATNGLVFKRLEHIYDNIFIDEVQDLNGYDLEFLEALFHSNISVYAVGDPRQWTYSTNRSRKNKQYKGANISTWFKEQCKNGLCEIEERNECHRCNQTVCDFADALYPDEIKTVSKNTKKTNHDGVFVISPDDARQYCETFSPRVLRYDKNADTLGHPGLNFGNSKGRTFDRVLIIPTGPISKYLESGDLGNLREVSKAKLYVAVTRARYSIAFLHEEDADAIVPRYTHRNN